MAAPSEACEPVSVTSRPLTDSLAREGPPADGRASGAPGPAEPSMLSHRFARSESDRVVLGVAGGLGRHFGVDPLLIRLGFAVLVAAGGLGIVLYVVAWGASVAPSPTPPDHSVRWLPRNRQIAATGCIVVGLLLIARDLGLWFGDPVVWPLALAAGGSAVIWGRGDDGGRRSWPETGARSPAGPFASVLAGRASPLRIGVGALLVAGGMATFLEANRALTSTRAAALAVVVTAAGLGLILGPWIVRLARDAAEERRQRIRSEERAEIAAHLHDFVLHTLALIQRSEAPAEITALARRQERELRAWLGGRPSVEAEVDLRGAVDAMASRVEENHHLTVDTVVVGDAPVDERVRALVLACQEAVTNAARHAGAPRVSLFLEADSDAITAYIRDQGRGFDPAAVPSDRRGIAESIVGRMRRQGGTATIVSRLGEGTEVQLRLPRTGG